MKSCILVRSTCPLRLLQRAASSESFPMSPAAASPLPLLSPLLPELVRPPQHPGVSALVLAFALPLLLTFEDEERSDESDGSERSAEASTDDDDEPPFLPADAATADPWNRTLVAAGATGASRALLPLSDAPPPPALLMSRVLLTRTRANDEGRAEPLAEDEGGGLGGLPLRSGAEAGCVLGIGARPAPNEE